MVKEYTMGMSRFAAIATGAALTLVFSASAGAVGSEGECISNDGTVMDLQGVKHCLVPVIPEEFQGDEYAGEIKGVKTCSGAVRKTSIGDFCLIALEAKPAATSTPAPSTTINEAIGDQAAAADVKAEMEDKATEKKKGLFGN